MTDPKLAARAAASKAKKQAAKQTTAKKPARKRGLGPTIKRNPLDAKSLYADRDISPEGNRRRAETSRLRVQTSNLIERVQKHAMGKINMTPTQLAAAQTLLRKTLPDLVGVKAEVDVSPVIFNFNMGVSRPKE